ncbi:LysE family translocator [Gammaproteobacteria bacterium AH-315-E17]|nr:LysE family translocator [Gammaproteobacteria bacterium AH-315-E17]MBN4075109.1 LysE family translocator [Gammaproteobacteria bacterium AH-315-E17]
MTLSSILALFIAMLVLAAIPGIGVLTVASRSIASGFTQGLITVLGVVTGDYIFIFLCIYGLSAVAEEMGQLFIIIKFLGAGYLIWLGVNLIRSKSELMYTKNFNKKPWAGNYLAGLLTTLGNPKAILFYVGFFPAFVDMTKVQFTDVLTILLIATITVGGVLVTYAYLASRTRKLFKNKATERAMNVTAGSILIGTGTLIAVRT